MRGTRILLICTALLVLGVIFVRWSNRERPVTLPNGFVLYDDTLFTPDGMTTLAGDIEFVCFDDRFLVVISKTRGQSGLFDAQTRSEVSKEAHPEIFQPGGLKYGRQACNGYYTAMIGPGLLRGDPSPFQPYCDYVNHDNHALKDKAWLNRPCDER